MLHNFPELVKLCSVYLWVDVVQSSLTALKLPGCPFSIVPGGHHRPALPVPGPGAEERRHQQAAERVWQHAVRVSAPSVCLISATLLQPSHCTPVLVSGAGAQTKPESSECPSTHSWTTCRSWWRPWNSSALLLTFEAAHMTLDCYGVPVFPLWEWMDTTYLKKYKLMLLELSKISRSNRRIRFLIQKYLFHQEFLLGCLLTRTAEIQANISHLNYFHLLFRMGCFS